MGIFFSNLVPINELEIKDSKGNVVNNDKEENKKPTPPPEDTTEEEDEDIGSDMPEGDDESDDSDNSNTDNTESDENEQDTEEEIGSDMPTDDDNTDDSDYDLPDDDGDTANDNDEDIGEDMPEGDNESDDSDNDTGEEDEDIGGDMPEGDDEEGEGDSESGAGGDTGNDVQKGKPSQKEEIEAIEKELFSDLSDDQMAIKHKELKGQFIDMYESIGDIIDRVNIIPKTDKNIKTLEFIGAKLGELREIINYNLTEGYDTRGYVENVVIYQQCLVTLNTIDQLLKEIIPETDKEDQT